jgi:hypothetical protein
MTDRPLHSYRVGDRYHPDRTFWPERGEYNFRQGEHELRLFYASPSKAEIAAVRAGEAHFALLAAPPVIIFCYRFAAAPGFEAGIPWSDAPYTWHMVPEDQRTLPLDLPHPTSRALLNIVLVDAGTGIIRALRAVTFSPEFSRALHRAIHDQAASSWRGQRHYEEAVEALYRRYPTSEAFVAAAQDRCTGGEP